MIKKINMNDIILFSFHNLIIKTLIFKMIHYRNKYIELMKLEIFENVGTK